MLLPVPTGAIGGPDGEAKPALRKACAGVCSDIEGLGEPSLALPPCGGIGGGLAGGAPSSGRGKFIGCLVDMAARFGLERTLGEPALSCCCALAPDWAKPPKEIFGRRPLGEPDCCDICDKVELSNMSSSSCRPGPLPGGGGGWPSKPSPPVGLPLLFAGDCCDAHKLLREAF